MALRLDQVGRHHFGAHFTRRYLRYPPQLALGLRRTAQPCLHFCWTKIARISSEEHTSELQSLMRTSYAVFCITRNYHPIKRTLHYTTSTNYNHQYPHLTK